MAMQQGAHHSTQHIDEVRKELDTFLHAVSHELSAPIRHVKQITRLLNDSMEEKLAEKDRRYMRTILNAMDRSEDSMDRLLQLSRVNTRAKPFGAVNCDDLIEEAKTILAFKIDESNAQIHAVPLPAVQGDADQLTQVFVELISNAIKFRSENVAPRIDITVHPQDGYWSFQFADNGIGIEQGKEERVFEPFKMLNRYGTQHGVGMGLTIVKKIITRHGGTITINHNEDNAGTTICFTLPVGQTKSQQHH